MAIPCRVPVHYLLNLIDGYAASKWASETLLEKVAMNNGLPVYIHRLAHVQGDDASELDAIGMLTKYSLLLGPLPQIEHEAVTGQWDFIEVDDVSRDLIETACESAIGICRSSSELTEQLFQLQRPIFFNHCNPVKTSHSELRNYLEGVVGKPLHLMVMGDWLKAAREKRLRPLVHEFFEAFDEGGGAMVLPVIAKTAQ
ncbi:hypothetical protein HYALB_00000817 [Hymenoscyphus albidus]|uniref:Thioester reductase (TE) domain-containing protein n=1 Tax=Hymenoscyphus albidus TaxID=595503 RepID=A0A9N9LCT2_9HELO|nr:hypothetical protein HYALB_00000817 [Hymenoscyphus albidus]